MITLFLCFTGPVSQGQGRVQEAEREIELFNYSKAVAILQGESARGNERSRQETALLLADCYRMMNDAENAKTWYEKALLNTSPGQKHPVQPVNWYNYAQVLRTCGQYRVARREFLRYDSLAPGDGRGKMYAAYCDSAQSWQSAGPRYLIRNVREVNSPQSEFGAVFYKNGLLFASDRSGDKGKIYGWTGNG